MSNKMDLQKEYMEGLKQQLLWAIKNNLLKKKTVKDLQQNFDGMNK